MKFILKQFILFITIFLITITNISALSFEKDAKKIDIISKEITGEKVYVKIIIKNITPNIYVTGYDDATEEIKVYKYSDSNKGVIEINQYYFLEKVNYEFKIHNIKDELILTKNLTTRKFNTNSIKGVCKKNPEYKECEMFYDKEIDEKEFDKNINQYIMLKEAPFYKKIWMFIIKYYLFILVPIISVSMLYVIAYIIIKRGKKK